MFDNATWLETLGVFLALAVFWIVGSWLQVRFLMDVGENNQSFTLRRSDSATFRTLSKQTEASFSVFR